MTYTRRVPSVPERLATLETLSREILHRLESVEDAVNGGGDVSYDRSVRGRLHKLESVAASAVLRRNLGVGLLKGWERFAVVLAAVATACASWYAVLH